MTTIHELIGDIVEKTKELAKLAKLEFPPEEQDSERQDEDELTPEELQERSDVARDE